MSVLSSHAEIVFTDEGDRTCAEAVLDMGRDALPRPRRGHARPLGDPDIPTVYEELSLPRSVRSRAQAAACGGARIEKFGD